MVISEEIKQKLKELGLTKWAYYTRIYRGWSPEEALNMPKVGAVHTINGKPIYSQLNRSQYHKFLRLYSKTKNLNTAFTKAREK